MSRSQRPIWLGQDQRGWDHARIHRQLLVDPALDPSNINERRGPHRSHVLAVYLGLAIHAETQTGDTRPAQATLARYTGCSVKTVARCLEVLVGAGYLAVEERPGSASLYRLLPPPTLDQGSEVAAREAVNLGPGDGGTPDLGSATLDPGSDELEEELEPSDEPSRDVVRLCELLADLIAADGSKRPTVTKTWLSDCEKMIRIDGRDPVKIERAIRWCQADPFWRTNVLSMRTLREKYDQLRKRAMSERAPRQHGENPFINTYRDERHHG